MSSGRRLHFDRIEGDGAGGHAERAGRAAPRRWLYLLHGIFGAGRNWRSIASRLVEARPDWGAVLIDLRLHGASQGFEPPHTLAACAADLERLSLHAELPAAGILGHSFGGKVALSHVALNAQAAGVASQVWIMDSTPSSRPAVGDAERMLRTVKSLPEQFPSREAVIGALLEAGFPERVAGWMSTNLERAGSRYQWKLDFEALESLLQDFFRTDMWPVVEEPPPGVELHFVKASRSRILTDGEAERIRQIGRTRPVRLHVVTGGHWLNADNPAAVIDLLASHLPAEA
jgi:pimeloyl-ACP methyl ester carboxylesterase